MSIGVAKVVCFFLKYTKILFFLTISKEKKRICCKFLLFIPQKVHKHIIIAPFKTHF